MLKKKWLFAGLAVATIGVTLTIFAFLPPTPGPTYANFSRLEKGMTREQVERLLGKPNAGEEYETVEEDFITVHFDQEGRVRECFWNGMEDGRGGWEKMRDRMPFIAKPASRQFPILRL